MGEFTKLVRDGVIPGPLRRAFTREKWKKEFDRLHEPDVLDHDTYAAGLALHEKFTNIRDALTLSSSKCISATTKIRAFLAVVNHNFFVTHSKTEQAIDKFRSERDGELGGIYALEEMAGIKLRLPGGFDWMPNEIMESLVDGIELGIKVVLQENPSLAGNPQFKQVEWMEAHRELNLGILYRFAEDVWDDCLWNEYKMVEKKSFKIFLPQDVDVIRSYRIGLARRLSISTSFSIIAEQFQRHALAQGGKLRVRELSGIERKGKRQYISVDKSGAAPGEVIKQLTIQRALAVEPYYEELIEERLESLGGLTLSSLIDAWMVISCAAHLLLQSIGEKHKKNIGADNPAGWMPEYVPAIQVDALLDALELAAGIKKPEGRKIVEFFTFRGRPGQEIWAQPLVPVGLGTVAPVFAAVVSPNLRRLVDVWMRQAGIDLARRGPAFEAHVRNMVAARISGSSRLASSAKSINEDYTFRPGSGRDEQIDLIFCIGNTVFIAEAKCILEPTDSKGVAIHRKTVMGASEQVLRKAKSLEESRAEFCKDVIRFGIYLADDFKVVPLIVVSTSTHVGIAALNVPVIDELILGRYLDGELEDIAYQVGDPDSSKRIKTIFYSNPAEAEERAPQYFASPPQLQRFIDGVRGRIVPIYAANDADWSAYIVMMECVAGGVPLALKGQEGSMDNSASTSDPAED